MKSEISLKRRMVGWQEARTGEESIARNRFFFAVATSLATILEGYRFFGNVFLLDKEGVDN